MIFHKSRRFWIVVEDLLSGVIFAAAGMLVAAGFFSVVLTMRRIEMTEKFDRIVTSLDDLALYLAGYAARIATLSANGEEDRAEELRHAVDMSDLPAFGGDMPEDTAYPIWSWDETRVLVGEGLGDLKIVDREEVS